LDKIQFKNVTFKDCRFIYNLKFSREVRKNSLNKKKASYKSHQNWLQKQIANKKSLFLIIKNKKKLNERLGYIRLDFKNFYYRVTIAILKNKTNKNYGFQALLEAEKKVKTNSILIAEVIKSNTRSIKLFKKCKYSLIAQKKKIKIFIKFTKKNEK